MSIQRLAILAAAIMLVLAGLFFFNWTDISKTAEKVPFISPTDVRGISIEYDGKLWPVDFETQLFLIAFFNQSRKVSDKGLEKEEQLPSITRVLIHRFQQPDLDVQPIMVVDGQLIYRQQEWNPQGYLMEQSEGVFKQLIDSSYDH